jgi:hypothetical protein
LLRRLAVRRLHGAADRHDLAEEIAGRVWRSLVVNKGRRLHAYDPARGPLASFLAVLVR